MSDDYCFIIQAHLDTRWSIWFEGLAITNLASGQALLTGQLADQAALYGVLLKIRDLGLPLVAVMPQSFMKGVMP